MSLKLNWNNRSLLVQTLTKAHCERVDLSTLSQSFVPAIGATACVPQSKFVNVYWLLHTCSWSILRFLTWMTCEVSEFHQTRYVNLTLCSKFVPWLPCMTIHWLGSGPPSYSLIVELIFLDNLTSPEHSNFLRGFKFSTVIDHFISHVVNEWPHFRDDLGVE